MYDWLSVTKIDRSLQNAIKLQLLIHVLIFNLGMMRLAQPSESETRLQGVFQLCISDSELGNPNLRVQMECSIVTLRCPSHTVYKDSSSHFPIVKWLLCTLFQAIVSTWFFTLLRFLLFCLLVLLTLSCLLIAWLCAYSLTLNWTCRFGFVRHRLCLINCWTVHASLSVCSVSVTGTNQFNSILFV